MLEIEGLSPIKIGVARNAEAILVPHCANIILSLESERVRVLAQAVKKGVLGEASP